jgi:Cupredoxin-like domain
MRFVHILTLSAAVVTALALLPQASNCADADTVFAIKAEGGRFTPPQLEVVPNQPFKVRVTSAEKTPIEFESFELRRERVVKPGETITVNMPALSPGTYKFFDDFHRDTPEGAIVVK